MLDMDEICKQIKLESKIKGLEKDGMSIKKIIDKLSEFNPEIPVIISMKQPIYDNNYDIEGSQDILVSSNFEADSWRGSYDLPSIEYTILPKDFSIKDLDITVANAISQLQEINGTNVTGYKGGDFTLDDNDILFIANYGNSNYSIAITKIQEVNGIVIAYTDNDMY